MDGIEKFLSENRHQLGYIMSEASRQWIKENPTGALTVGPCNIFIEKYGDYHALQDKVERYQKALKRIACCDFDGWSGSDVLGKVTDFASEILQKEGE